MPVRTIGIGCRELCFVFVIGRDLFNDEVIFAIAVVAVANVVVAKIRLIVVDVGACCRWGGFEFELPFCGLVDRQCYVYVTFWVCGP